MDDDQTTPTRLNLKKDEKLEIDWRDGRRCTYPISLLRSMCPCASCRGLREGHEGHPPAIQAVRQGGAGGQGTGARPKKMSLSVLPGDHTQPLSALSAELVGNYALRIDWSDKHGSGIYSFQYLREICPPGSAESGAATVGP